MMKCIEKDNLDVGAGDLTTGSHRGLPLQRDLPEGWEIVALNNICEINPILDKSKFPVDMEVSFVPMAAVGASDGKIDVSQKRSFHEVKKGFTSFQSGDVLFAKITPCMENGKMAVVPKLTNECGFGSTEFHVLRPNYGTDARYIYYYVSCENFRREAAHNMTGAVGQKRVSTSYLREQKIPLAPLDQQNLIVSEIEKQFSRLDEAVAALKRVRVSLKRYKASVLKAAVEGKLTEEWRKRRGAVASPFFETNKLRKGGETPPLQKQGADLPEGWQCARLAEVAEINPKLPKNIPDNVEVSFLPMKLVQEETGVIDLSITKKFGEVKKGYTSFINNDIIFAKITPCMENGKIAIVENLRNGLGFGSTEFHVIRSHEPKSIKYLFYFLLQRDIRKQAQRNMTGTAGQLRVPTKFMQEISVSLPPISEQQKIVEEIESRLSVTEEIEEAIDINLKRAERLRQAILKKAFSGRLIHQANKSNSKGGVHYAK